jgi:hypothetical protein
LVFLKAHDFDDALQSILKLGLLPDDVRSENLEEEGESVLMKLRTIGGLPDTTTNAVGKALAKFDEVQAAWEAFDPSNDLITEEVSSFTMSLLGPMGLCLEDDTMVALSVAPGGQAELAGVPPGC